jgi:hypothetical protein
MFPPFLCFGFSEALTCNLASNFLYINVFSQIDPTSQCDVTAHAKFRHDEFSVDGDTGRSIAY